MKNRTESHAAEATPEELLQNIHRLMNEVEALIAQPGTPEDGADSKLAHLRTRLNGATEKLQDFYQSARKKITAGARQADETIRSHPYESMAVALGVGVLLGVLIRRGRRD
jgi:ElaB/YqjD/DUF883 family membrane-anchored ribosome-binding protein